jgi:hypothetical protein
MPGIIEPLLVGIIVGLMYAVVSAWQKKWR